MVRVIASFIIGGLTISCGKSDAEKEAESRAEEEMRAANAHKAARERVAEIEKRVVLPEPPPPPPPPPPRPWHYSEQTDKMRGTTSRLARATSTNSVDDRFGNAVRLKLILKRDGNTESAYVQVTSGMVSLCFMDCTVAVKFDTGAVQNFSTLDSTDIPPTGKFIQNVARFVKQTKAASRLTIELSMADGILRQFEFDLEGLEWGPAPSKPPATGKR